MSDKHTFYSTCPYFTAAKYIREMERLAQKNYAPTGMAPAYSYIMMTLQDENPQTINDLSSKLGYDHSTISRMSKKLADKELILQSCSGRTTLLQLTKEGKIFLKVANVCSKKMERKTATIFGENEKKQLVQDLINAYRGLKKYNTDDS
ncbi:MarR family winged helix-turn-helix transcriptional regulator [Liquorilactobacillus uvarum]|uniref:MarR family winged helix-turn-helix transcriptional regulator n=1 Tax=Liquorilactobacillus uvarum TaxID=303240 RepID=UPI002889502C|nr:MarR family transcriptional regulator [Liquorilactobacillus uvarum]